MKPASLLIICLTVINLQNLSAQYYNTGQDPASLKWLQIKTDRFTVIYPERYGEAGTELAHALDISLKRMGVLFPDQKIRIPIVVHNFSTRSNGYVAWAPKRMELYPVSEQNALPGNQELLLSLHELTHVYQMESLNTGFTRLMSFMIGQQMPGIVSSLLPEWYLEGHAVTAESTLSSSGRGRSPAFLKQLKALTTESPGLYKYDKILNGSFRDYVPDHYQYGYQMVARGITRYGTGIWNETLRFTGEQPFTLLPVNISLRRNAGLTKRKLYFDTFSMLKKTWEQEISETQTYETVNPPKNGEFKNYYSPVFAGTDTIIAIKTSLSQPPVIVRINIDNHREEILHRPGFMYPYRLDSKGNKLVWVESRPDPRWQNRDYSVIIVHDLKTGRTKKLTERTRYLSAALSPDGQTICAVENTPDNHNNIVLIDAGSGKKLRSIPSPFNYYLQKPEWTEDAITVIYLTGTGEGVMSYKTRDNSWKTLLEPGHEDIQDAYLRKDTLFYVGSGNGTDNIYYTTGDGIQARQVTRSRYGTSDPDYRENKVVFSDYTSEGNTISITTIDMSQPVPADSNFFQINRLDSAINFRVSETEDLEKKSYTPVPYSKLMHLFRFHSWMPFYADLDQIQSDPLSLRPGFTLMSQNTLSTLESTFGYEYSIDGRHLFHSKIRWMGSYPVFESRIDYGHMPQVLGDPDFYNTGFRYSGEISLPLSFNSGWFSQFVRPSVNIDYSNNIYPLEDGYDYGQTSITMRLFFSNHSRTAHRDIYPMWSQSIDLNYYTSPFDRELFGSTLYLRSSFYFPGIFRDNGIRLRFNAEKQDQPRFLFSNRISLPRGYEMIVSRELRVFTSDYVFPVAYPDFNIWSIFYLKRIRAGLFYDYATGRGNRHYNSPGSQVPYYDIFEKEAFRSYGIELLTDFHLFRIPFMISGGVQAAWKNLNQPPVIGLMFNMDLYGFSIGI